MKICHIITRMVIGGAQENTLYSCRGQIEAGHSVTLLTGNETGEEGDLLQQQVEQGLIIKRITTMKRNISLSDDFRAYRALRQYFRHNKFDVVHTHSSKAGLLGRLAAYQEKIPCVVHTIHGLPFHPYQKWYKNLLYIWCERLAARYCHKIFSVADAMTKQALAKKIGKKNMYQTIRSGMEIESYSAVINDDLRKQLGISSDKIVVGKIARLFELKGHHQLIKIARQIIDTNDKIIFLLIGNGILLHDLEQEISKQGLQNHFIFTGLISPNEIARYITCMDIVIHLSLREGLPRAVVQALASSRPVIAYNLDGTPEVVKHYETGLLYLPHQQQAIIDGLNELINNKHLRQKLGKQGRQLVLQQFSWQKMVKDLQKKYQAILDKKS